MRYKIWDRKEDIICPSGDIFTPEQWMERYPVAQIESLNVVCADGVFNGAYFGILEQMKKSCENAGCDFSVCTSNEEILQKIEDFEIEMNTPDTTTATAEERIAAALEAQVMLSMPDDETT